jgi:hypothetical protein
MPHQKQATRRILEQQLHLQKLQQQQRRFLQKLQQVRKWQQAVLRTWAHE